MRDSNFLVENNARHVWHPMAHPGEMRAQPPKIIHEAEGVEVIDVHGHRLLDAVGGLWNVNLGYSCEPVKKAMRDQLDRFGEIDVTAKLLGQVAAATTTALVLNRDDPRIAALATEPGDGGPSVSYYGVAPELRSQFPNDEELYGGPLSQTKLPAAAELLALATAAQPRTLLRVGSVAALLGSALYVLEVQARYRLPETGQWVQAFHKIATVSWLAAALLVADVLVGWARRDLEQLAADELADRHQAIGDEPVTGQEPETTG